VKGTIDIDFERCKGCGLCVAVCPKQQIDISEDLNAKGYYPAHFKGSEPEASEEAKCTGCALCAVTCPDVAIEVYRESKKDSDEQNEK
jgi:2-oxoglutarate ferredoxin oxidoreductase subunit delta